MTLIKIIVLQAFWFLAVLGGPKIHDSIIALVLVVILFLNYKFYAYKTTSIIKYISLALAFTLYGLIQDLLVYKAGVIDFHEGYYPFWLLSLFSVFICYYGDIFNYMASKPRWLLVILGGLGGASAYYSGFKFESIIVSSENLELYIICMSLSWAIFFPLSIELFYNPKYSNKVLDMSIYYSFDKSGFERHIGCEKVDYDFSNLKKVMITGGSSGLGNAAALELVKAGVETIITGRNQNKVNDQLEMYPKLKFIALDMADWNSIRASISGIENLDGLVLNAGGMPETFQTNEYGVESQMASQLFGHYYLLKTLYEEKKFNDGARVIWMSSGGMYLSSLSLEEIFSNPKYDKVSTYANVKRAQVSLLKEMSQEFPSLAVIGTHPGWVDTPGVQDAIGGFHKKMEGRLRTPLQGADSILWPLTTLKLESGEFYFDHKKVAKNFFFFTKVKTFDVQKLKETLHEYFLKFS